MCLRRKEAVKCVHNSSSYVMQTVIQNLKYLD